MNDTFDPPRLAVFCGSRYGAKESYRDAAANLGTTMARRGLGVVYGGGAVGLMGVVADAALKAKGEVIGVIPEALSTKEIAHPNLTRQYVVQTMHQRKFLMATFCDGFVVLPGGWGTMEEMFEAVSWTVLNYQRKPVGILDVDGYYASLIAFLDHATAEGFIAPVDRALLVREEDPDALIDRLAEARRGLGG